MYNNAMRNIAEGYMPFRKWHTYYRIVHGGNKTPIILLHGGPGSTHNYFEVLDCIADTGRDIIMYDQLGCGNSYVDNESALWRKETWIEELETLRNYLHLSETYLLGQSWGGMLEIAYMIDKRPEGIKGLVLSSTLSSASLWAHEQHRLISFMSEEDQKAIVNAEKNNDWNNEAYLKANDHFMKAHCADIKESDPECLRRKKKSGTESYLYAWGPNEYNPTGTLKDFEYTDKLNDISVPCLIMSGTNDLCTPLVAKTMYDHLKDVQWELFDGARHMCFAEQTEHYCDVLSKWLSEHD